MYSVHSVQLANWSIALCHTKCHNTTQVTAPYSTFPPLVKGLFHETTANCHSCYTHISEGCISLSTLTKLWVIHMVARSCSICYLYSLAREILCKRPYHCFAVENKLLISNEEAIFTGANFRKNATWCSRRNFHGFYFRSSWIIHENCESLHYVKSSHYIFSPWRACAAGLR